MTNNTTTADEQKFAYFEGAQRIRGVLDRVSELAHLADPPSDADRDYLCDSLIELHQILYGVTLFMARTDESASGSDYARDEIYSTGRPVVSRALVPLTHEGPHIPPHAYQGDIGEDVEPGTCIHVWRPDEDTVAVAEERDGITGSEHWKLHADLRAEGMIDWARDDDHVIVKHCHSGGRLRAACSVTERGLNVYGQDTASSPHSARGDDAVH